MVWEFYSTAEKYNYRIVKLQEDDDFELNLEKDTSRHFTAKKGDHLMISFQCKLCQFRNLKGCNPGIRFKEIYY